MVRGLLAAAIAVVAVARAAADARACTGAECYLQAATLGEAPATGASVLRFPQAIAYAGAHRLTFRARLRGRPLRAGRYRLVMRATDTAGNRAAPKRLAFTVVASG